MSMGAHYKPELTYGDYLKVPELLQLQVCLSEPAHHDELQFIIVHQVYELWFKLMLHEIDEAMARLNRDDVRTATRLMRRVIGIQKVLLQQIEVLESMRPVDFLGFRNHLKPASGFQSWQFRELEFVSGGKDQAFLRHHQDDELAMARLRKRWEEPSLRDVFFDVLRRQGFQIPPGSEFDEETQRQCINELREIHAEPDRYHDVYQLCEALIEYDEHFILWRDRHVRMVERMIGKKEGTGGSEGVLYLETTMAKRFFPELWAVRTELDGGGAPRPYGQGAIG
ncbi:MAG: tryptophan 2,3-dioxygenase [Acidobacteria bacterium]|nr:tryptophan 2,3-dioxygenase [Acidobacteriota bacterium]